MKAAAVVVGDLHDDVEEVLVGGGQFHLEEEELLVAEDRTLRSGDEENF